MDRKQLSHEGPTINEIELIGMELAVTDSQGHETELEMRGMQRTMPNGPWDRQRVRVTVHTSNGDITMRCPLRPGNYEVY